MGWHPAREDKFLRGALTHDAIIFSILCRSECAWDAPLLVHTFFFPPMFDEAIHTASMQHGFVSVGMQWHENAHKLCLLFPRLSRGVARKF